MVKNNLVALTVPALTVCLAVVLDASDRTPPKKDLPHYPIPISVPSLGESSAAAFDAAKARTALEGHELVLMSGKDPVRIAAQFKRLLASTASKPSELKVFVRDVRRNKYLTHGYRGSSKILNEEYVSPGIPPDRSPVLLISYTAAETMKKVYYQFELTGRC